MNKAGCTHTAGPWHVGGKDRQPIVYASDGFAVCDATVFHGTFKEGQTEANARLIAAAPELADAATDALAEWRYIRAQHGDLPGVGWDRVEAALTAALAKASPSPVAGGGE